MVRRAFLKKSREHHPDRNPDDPNSEYKMAEIIHANSILADPQKKSVYDHFGSKVLIQS